MLSGLIKNKLSSATSNDLYTKKGEPFTGTEVSRKAVGTYIADIIMHPDKDKKASVGIHKPGVYGDKPAFY